VMDNLPAHFPSINCAQDWSCRCQCYLLIPYSRLF
jgi:hypothetical protein